MRGSGRTTRPRSHAPGGMPSPARPIAFHSTPPSPGLVNENGASETDSENPTFQDTPLPRLC